MDQETRRKLGGNEQVIQEKANVLLIGDKINCFPNSPGADYNWATVTCVTENYVEYVRPFIHVSNHIGSGLINGDTGQRLAHYVGTEVIRIERHSDRIYSVVFRSQTPE